MDKLERESLLQSVEGLHNCKATFKEKTHVLESFEGDLVWEGDVYVFDLEGHPEAKTAYAWSSPVDGSDNMRFYAVLKIDPVESPLDAVRASIANDLGG